MNIYIKKMIHIEDDNLEFIIEMLETGYMSADLKT